MVDCLQKLNFIDELNTKWNLATSRKTYSLRPLCETGFSLVMTRKELLVIRERSYNVCVVDWLGRRGEARYSYTSDSGLVIGSK